MDEKESRLVAKNYLYSLSYQVLILILPLATAPYLTRVLGKANLGSFDYAFSLVSYFVLFGCVGVSLYGQRETAYVKNDPERRTQVFWELVILRFFTLSAATAGFFLIVVAHSQRPALLAIVGAELVSAMFDISWFYQGLDNFRVQMARNFAVKLVFVLLVFLLVKNETQLLVYAASYTGVNVLGNLSTWLGLGRYLKKIPLRSLRFWRHLWPTVLLFLPQIATSVYTQLDKTMLGRMLDDGNISVAVYSYSEKIVKLALTVITSLNLVMLSRVAGYQSEGDQRRSVEAIRRSFRFSAALAFPIGCGLAAVAPMFVPWFYGEDWADCIPVMILLCPIVLFIGLSGVFGVQYLLPARRMKAYTFSVLIGAVSNFTLNFILIPRFGATGAAVATVAAEFAVLLAQAIILRKEFGVRLYLSVWRYLLAGAVMGFAVYETGRLLQRRMGGTLLQVLVGVCLYALLLWILRDPFFLKLVRRFLRRKEGSGDGKE